jgi:hypothetical protein
MTPHSPPPTEATQRKAVEMLAVLLECETYAERMNGT